ncbi:MAG TPA: glucose-6-phosphate dehydrogenase [Elusimicrobiota bacterium]|nr:glucose-6-phosphate dehydrogenase [Elusimicrobiota bacterium]
MSDLLTPAHPARPVPASDHPADGQTPNETKPVSVSRVIAKEELCLLERVPSPCGIVIFGASGDLTHRKLLPALFSLVLDKLMPAGFYILGMARTPMSDDAFRETIQTSLGTLGTPAERKDFAQRCHYMSADYGAPAAYNALRERLGALDRESRTNGRHLFYLSTPPSLYEAIAHQLGAAGLAGQKPDGWTRIVIEKPFGHDLASAQALSRSIHAVFEEDQIYRIDHYLGKETVQNILMFRFANAIYEPIWNHHYIDQVQITAAESDGVGHRAGYYEQAGALRDMFQNHLFQLLSLVAMEPPCSFDPDAVRGEKAKVMSSLVGLSLTDLPHRVVRGQYGPGTTPGGRAPGYRNEPGVRPDSAIETYAALRVEIDNWRWTGVPFYLRSGKRLQRRVTEIAVQFKHVPTSIFKPLMAEQITANVLHFRIQPNEGITLQFEAKHPGPKLCMSTVQMSFDYEQAFGIKPPEAYARLFQDVMLGDPTLFARQDWLTASWSFLDPVLDYWKSQRDKGLAFYPAGSWGPEEADRLLADEDRQWLM